MVRREAEQFEIAEIFTSLPYLADLLLDRMRAKLSKHKTPEGVQKQFIEGQRGHSKIFTAASNLLTVIKMFYVFVKDNYGYEAWRGWLTFSSLKLLTDFLELNYSGEGQETTCSNTAKLLQEIIRHCLKVKVFFNTFCNGYNLAYNQLLLFKEKLSKKKERTLLNKLSYKESKELKCTFSRSEKAVFINKLLEKLEQLRRKIFRITDKCPKDEISLAIRADTFQYQRILLTLVVWTCGIDVVLRAENFQSMTIKNVAFDKTLGCFTFINDFNEKIVREIPMKDVPLQFPKAMNRPLEMWVNYLHVYLAKTDKIKALWLSTKTGTFVTAATISQWFKDIVLKYGGKYMTLLEARYVYATHTAKYYEEMLGDPVKAQAYLSGQLGKASHSEKVFRMHYSQYYNTKALEAHNQEAQLQFEARSRRANGIEEEPAAEPPVKRRRTDHGSQTTKKAPPPAKKPAKKSSKKSTSSQDQVEEPMVIEIPRKSSGKSDDDELKSKNPYPCRWCTKRYKRPQNRYEHQVKKHREEWEAAKKAVQEARAKKAEK